MVEETKQRQLAERHMLSNINLLVVAILFAITLGIILWIGIKAELADFVYLYFGFVILLALFVFCGLVLLVCHTNKVRKNNTLLSLSEDELTMNIHKLYGKITKKIPIETLISVDIKKSRIMSQWQLIPVMGLPKHGKITLKYREKNRQMKVLIVEKVLNPESVAVRINALIAKKNKTKKDSLLEYIMNPNAKK